MKRWRVCSLLVSVSLLCCFSARANGRFPNAEQVREISPGSLVVSGTYGLLVSGNSKDFQFVCESALFGKTLMGSWVDPLLEVLPDGTILSGSVNGLRVSRDHGCTFQSDWSLPYDPAFIPPDPSASGPAGTVIDLCPSYDTPQGMVALTTLSAEDGTTLDHRLYRTRDGAHTWSAFGAPIPTSLVRVVLTVDVAPSDPQRIYVSGSSLGQSVLVTSRDAGATWTANPIAVDDESGVLGSYIAAVSPSDPDRVYLRVSRRSLADDGSTTWDDSLLVSDDAGSSARQVLRQPAALLGFALSPDGTNVLAGYGDPVVAPVVVGDDAVGLYAASSDVLEFSRKVANFSVSCLRWAADGLFACAKENDPLGTTSDPAAPDFHLGVFTGTGVPERLADFTPLVKLKDLRGPLPLASGAPSACDAEWSDGDPSSPGQASVCASLNACVGSSGAVPLSPGSFVCGAPGPEVDAGPTGVGGTGGSAPMQAAAGGQVAAGGSAPPATRPSSPSSSCRLAVRSQSSAPGSIASLVCAALLGLRRTRRATSLPGRGRATRLTRP